MSHVFISYSKKNREYARAIADKLLDEGFNVWIDDRIDYGENWERVIFKAIDDCAAFIVLMTPQSYESIWVQRECHYAEKRGKPPFPVLVDGVEEFPRYGLTQYVDVRGGVLPPADFYERLARFAPRSSDHPGAEVMSEPQDKAIRHEDITETAEFSVLIDDDDKDDNVIPDEASRQPPPPPVTSQVTPSAVPAAAPTPTPTPAAQPAKQQGLMVSSILALLVMLGIIGALLFNNAGDNGGESGIVDMEATSPEEYFTLGMDLEAKGRYADALEAYNWAIDLDSTQSNYYIHRAFAYHNLEDFEAAIADLTTALEMGTSYESQVYADRAEAHYRLGDYEAALGDYDMALSTTDDDGLLVMYFKGRGDVQMALESYDRAIDDYFSGMEINDDPVFYWALGDAFYAIDAFDDALEKYRRYVERVGEANAIPYVLDRIVELEEKVE